MQSDKLAAAVKRVRIDVPPILKPLGLTLAVVGLAGFAAALFVDANAAWRAYLSNFAFWTGLAFGPVMWSVVMRITNARWGRSMTRLLEGTVFYLPVLLVMYVVLVIGGLNSDIYLWVHEPIYHKEVWLAPWNTFTRATIAVLLLFAFLAIYVYYSLKADVRVLRGERNVPDFYQRLFASADGSEAEWNRTQHILKRLAPAVAIVYAVAASMMAFDLLMSLEPYWFSTMFGGFYFVGNLHIGLAFAILVGGLLRKRGLMEDYIGKNQFWDLGKLLFGFAMVWTYLMWSQYLPIWYANMHEEIGYVLKRTSGPYESWAYLLLALCWLVPWLILLPKSNKLRPMIAGFASAVVLIGMWLERWTMVIPAQFDIAPVPAEMAIFPGWIDIVTASLYGGLFLLSYRFFLKSSPVLPVGDPVFQHVVEHGSHGHH